MAATTIPMPSADEILAKTRSSLSRLNGGARDMRRAEGRAGYGAPRKSGAAQSNPGQGGSEAGTVSDNVVTPQNQMPPGQIKRQRLDTDASGGLHTGSLDDPPTRVGRQPPSAVYANALRTRAMAGLGLSVPGNASGKSTGAAAPDSDPAATNTARASNLAPGARTPVVIGGTPADSQATVRSALLHQPDPLTSDTVGQGQTMSIGHGQVVGAGATVTAPDSRYGSQPMVSNPNGAPQNQYGDTGIIRADGSHISETDLHGPNGAPTAPAQPMSHADQAAAIVKAYPKVGQAGTPENKLYVDSFKAGGSNMDSALDLAHSLFAPKTQADAMAQDMGGVTPRTLAADQTAVARAKLTPQQLAAEQASNNAQVAAAGQSVLDHAPSMASNIGAAIPEGFDQFGNTVVGGIKSAAGAVGDFFSGMVGSGGSSTPALVPPSPSSQPSTPASPGTMPSLGGGSSPNAPTASTTSPSSPGTPPRSTGTDSGATGTANATSSGGQPAGETASKPMAMSTGIDPEDEEQGSGMAFRPQGYSPTSVPARFARNVDDEEDEDA